MQSAPWQVEQLDWVGRKAFVRATSADYYTDAIDYTKLKLLDEFDADEHADARAAHGEVHVVRRVAGYKKIRYYTHENVGYGHVRLPDHGDAHHRGVVGGRSAGARPRVSDAPGGARRLPRRRARGASDRRPPLARRAARHRPRGRATADRRARGPRPRAPTDARKRAALDGAPVDVGADGKPFRPTLYLYDNFPGGIGIAAPLFDLRDRVLEHAVDLVAHCPCKHGCPACVGPVLASDETSDLTPKAGGITRAASTPWSSRCSRGAGELSDLRARLDRLSRHPGESRGPVPLPPSLADRLARLRARSAEINARRPTDGELAQRLGGTVLGPALLAVERSFPLPFAHGATRVAGAVELAEGARLSLRDDAELDAEGMLFLDTETSGLAGGTGTTAFVLGLATVRDDVLTVRQLLMTGFAGERPLLEHLATALQTHDCLVTFNGKSFDLPLLRARARLAGLECARRRAAPPRSAARHAPATARGLAGLPPAHGRGACARLRAHRRFSGRGSSGSVAALAAARRCGFAAADPRP